MLFFHKKKTERISYITSDSLSYIHLLPNNNFGLVSYKSISPIKDFYKKKRFSSSHFVISEFGAGNYKFKKNKLYLRFRKSRSVIDSITIKHENENIEKDSINLSLNFKSYLDRKDKEGIGLDIGIKDKKGKINVNTMFNDYKNINISKKDLPIILFIDSNYKLKINKKNDQRVELFINEFKKKSLYSCKKKIFTLNKLIKLNIEK